MRECLNIINLLIKAKLKWKVLHQEKEKYRQSFNQVFHIKMVKFCQNMRLLQKLYKKNKLL